MFPVRRRGSNPKYRVRRRLRTFAAMAPPSAPRDTSEAQFESIQSDLLDGKGPGPVIAVPQPAWAYPDVHNVVIMGAFHTVRVLSEVGLQTAITVDARRNVGDPLALHGDSAKKASRPAAPTAATC